MMVKAGILEKYSDVLAEFPVVVEAGGAWTSVTPGSQQYWLQAFNNVMYGRWENIQAGYGKAVLGYFGKTPLPPDPDVVKKASDQLELEPFDGDPLEAAPKNIEGAQQILRDHNLDVNDENTFLVLACMVPGGKVETNQGLNFLLGKPKIDIPLKKKEEPKAAAAPAAAPAAGMAPALTGPLTTVVPPEVVGGPILPGATASQRRQPTYRFRSGGTSLGFQKVRSAMTVAPEPSPRPQNDAWSLNPMVPVTGTMLV